MIRLGTLICGYLLTALAAVASPLPSSVSGTARVIDGDTIAIRQERIRIAVIDACEVDQTGMRNSPEWACGRVARRNLSDLTDGKHGQCLLQDLDVAEALLGPAWPSPYLTNCRHDTRSS